MSAHAPTEMMRGFSHYCGKGWKALFDCPACGRKTWQNLNFLGRRKLVCNGQKITKEAP